MKHIRRSFGFEFKKMIVDLVESGQYSMNQEVRDHETNPGLIVQSIASKACRERNRLKSNAQGAAA